MPSSISGNNMEVLENTQNSNIGKNSEPSKDLSQKYRLIALNTNDLIAFTTFDVNPIFTFVNPSYLKILGFDAEELLGKSWFDFIHQDNKQQIRTILIKYINAKINGILTADMVEGVQKLDFRIRDKSGHWHFLQSTINIVNDELLFISKDGTEQKHAEEALQRSEEMFSTVFRLSPENITLTSLKEGRYIDINESFLHTIGYSRDEVIGRTATELNIWVDPNDHVRFLKDLKEHGFIHNLEFHMRKKSGEVSTILMSSESITINGEPCALTVMENITDRKHIEDTLRENEQRMKSIIQGLSIAAFIIGSDHRVLYWNKALEELSNIHAEEIIGSSNHWKAFYNQKRPCMADILIDGGLDEIEKWYAGRYKKSSLLDESFEATDFFPNLGSDGKWLRFTATVIRNTNGDLIGILETLEDISERKKAEEALRESAERFRLAISSVTDILYEWKINTGSIEWFGDIDRRLGYERRTFPRTLEAFLRHVHPEDVNNVQTVATNGLKLHQKWEGEYRVIKKGGTEMYWYGTGIGIYDREGNPIKVVGSVTDITERKRAELLERALYEIARAPETVKSLNDLYHVVHLIIKGLMPAENFYVCLYDEKEDLLHYPYFVDEIDAWPQPEKPGKGLTAYVLRTGRTLLCDTVLDKELVRCGEVEMVGSPSACWLGAPLKVGEKIIGIIALQHYSDSKAYGEREKQILDFVSGQIANTIERKRAEEESQRMQELLQIVNRDLERKVQDRTAEIRSLLNQKDEFINQLGHDLKNPLTPLTTLLPILRKEASDTVSLEQFDVVIRNVEYMKNLVIKTLELAQLNSSNTILSLEDINLTKKINDTLITQRLMFQTKHITVDNKIPETIIVQADNLCLEELLKNLLTNAVKYTPEGGSITLNAKPEKECVTISIQDTGIGLTKEQTAHIFDEFYKVDQSRHDFDSSGLGLPICKRIAEKHGGKIWAVSEGLGKGTTLYFTLPRVQRNTESITNEKIHREIDNVVYTKN